VVRCFPPFGMHTSSHAPMNARCETGRNLFMHSLVSFIGFIHWFHSLVSFIPSFYLTFIRDVKCQVLCCCVLVAYSHISPFIRLHTFVHVYSYDIVSSRSILELRTRKRTSGPSKGRPNTSYYKFKRLRILSYLLDTSSLLLLRL
jgi:hypothetical protein